MGCSDNLFDSKSSPLGNSGMMSKMSVTMLLFCSSGGPIEKNYEGEVI